MHSFLEHSICCYFGWCSLGIIIKNTMFSLELDVFGKLQTEKLFDRSGIRNLWLLAQRSRTLTELHGLRSNLGQVVIYSNIMVASISFVFSG